MNEIFDFLGSNFIEIFSEEDTSKFDVGRVLSFDEEWLFLETVDRFGKFGGHMLLKRDSICKISYNTDYIKDLGIKVDENKQPSKEINLYESIVKKNIEEKRVVSVALANGDALIGILTKATENYLYIDVYMNNGQKDGSSIVSKEMIICIESGIRDCEGIQENMLDTIRMPIEK